MTAWSWTAALAWLEAAWQTGGQGEAGPDARWHLLLGAAACHRFGGVAGAEPLLKEMLLALPAETTGDPQVRNGAAYLLGAGGMPVPAPLCSSAVTRSEATPAGPLEFLCMNKADLHEQIACWTALTDYGRRPLDPALVPVAQGVLQVLPGVFAAESRTHDLCMVAGLLRLMVCLGADRGSVAQGVEYLAYQQRREGSFGYASPLTGGAPPATGTLPATAAALWALGEAEARLQRGA